MWLIDHQMNPKVKPFAKIIVRLPLKRDGGKSCKCAKSSLVKPDRPIPWEKRYPTYLSVWWKGILTRGPRRVANLLEVAHPCARNCIKSEPQLYQKRTDFIFLSFIKYSKIDTFTVASIFEQIKCSCNYFIKKLLSFIKKLANSKKIRLRANDDKFELSTCEYSSLHNFYQSIK